MDFLTRAALILLMAPPADSAGAGEGLEDAQTAIPALLVDLKYSTRDNFLHEDIYGELDRCLLPGPVVAMLGRAHEELRTMRPDLRFLAYDCTRPVSKHRLLWERVKGTAKQGYVADPDKAGSLHSRGCAIDLTLAAADGTPLDLGSTFDFFGPLAQPRQEIALLLEGKLSAEALGNRLLLRSVMVRAGFRPIISEWWHFDCDSHQGARRRFPVVP